MKNLILRHLQGKKVLFLFLLTNAVYAFMLLVTIPKVMSFAGGSRIPDMMPTGYAPFYIDLLFDELGEPGRSVYLTTQIPVDMIYPLLFGISYCLLMAFFLKKLDKLDHWVFYFSYLPLAAGLFDYLENIGVIMMLKQFPDISKSLVRISSTFTLLKSGLTTVYFSALIFVLLIYLVYLLKKKTQKT